MSVPLTVPSPSADGPEKPDMPSVLSYFAQRRAAGYIGFLLPPVVLIYDKYLTLGVSRTRARARDAVLKMGDGLPKPTCRSRLQTARCCCVQKAW